jgi:hypothetical protein
MLKKLITYKDYEGEDKTEALYFHLNKFEWLELETYTKGGLIENLKHAIETGNAKKTIDLLKKIILRAYGEKNPETGGFEKSEDISIRFSRTEAFSELFYALAYNEEASKSFFMGLIPPEVRGEAEKKMKELEKAEKDEDAQIRAEVVPLEVVKDVRDSKE